MRFFSNLAVLGSLAAFSLAQKGENVSGDYWIHGEILAENEDEAVFTVRMPENTWFGFMLGSSVMGYGGADCIVIDGGARTVKDRTVVGYVAPVDDEVQDVEGTFTDLGNGMLEVRILRALDTGDSVDYVLSAWNKFDMAWSYN